VKRFAAPVIAMALGLAVVALIIAGSTQNPAAALRAFFIKPFSSAWYVGSFLNLAGLLTLAASGAALAIRGGTFNLGGESQLYAPALFTAVALSSIRAGTLSSPAVIAVFAATLIAATALGALLGFFPGVLKAKFGTNELIVSFLLSAAIVPVLDYLVSGPFRDTSGSLIATREIDKIFRLPQILPPSSLNPSVFAALAISLALGVALEMTAIGYRYRLVGVAPEFARYAGFPARGITAASMALSGALHGLAGFFAITGTWFTCHQGITSGMGWGALAVALIARSNPFAIPIAALLYAWVQTAADAALLSSTAGFDSASIVQAIVFLVISARFIPGMRGSHD